MGGIDSSSSGTGNERAGPCPLRRSGRLFSVFNTALIKSFIQQGKCVMVNLRWSADLATCVVLGALLLSGCESKPPESRTVRPVNSVTPGPSESVVSETKTTESTRQGTADASDVKAARARIAELGARARCAPKSGDLLTEIVIEDGSKLKAEDIELFGKLSDLEKLQILNCRTLNDEMAAKLSGLKGLTSLALTNTVINDATVAMIVKSFPDLTDLNLSSNTNMTNGVMKLISELTKLQKLSLVQNRVNDISAQRIKKLRDLRLLDLRGNMEAGDMAMEVIGELPKLTSFKHRSTAVTDTGMEYLAKNQTLDSLLVQDFVITDQSGPHFAQLNKLTQLEVFRCQGFGTEGVLALKGMGLTRFTLRDLPNVDNRAMEVFDDLPKLKRLFLHELPTVGDEGLKHLASLKSLELLDIWNVPQASDATVDVIAALPQLKELSLRATAVTDAAIDKILAMPQLQSLTFKENGSVTPDGTKKLTARKWSKLDLGTSSAAETNE